MFMHEPTKLIVEVRQNSKQAAAQRGWDPITWGCRSKADLEECSSAHTRCARTATHIPVMAAETL